MRGLYDMLQSKFLVVFVGVVMCCERYVVLSAMFVYLSMVATAGAV